MVMPPFRVHMVVTTLAREPDRAIAPGRALSSSVDLSDESATLLSEFRFPA